MKRFIHLAAFVVLTAALSHNASAGFFDDLKTAVTSTNSSTASSIASVAGASGLSEDQMVGGLKQALGKGVEHAVSSLGHENGYMTNLNVKILLPDKIKSVETALRVAGQGQMVDDFISSMNHAAEKAVPTAAAVFGDSIQQMSIADSKNILSGPNDAATQYFRRTTQTNLHAQFMPLVSKATDEVGVTAKYKSMMGKFTSNNSFGGLFEAKSPVNLSAADIDSYVTDKAMDGLFKMVADEEKSIRANPLARTTDLLKTVFGSSTTTK